MDLECSHYILSLNNIYIFKLAILIKEWDNPPLSQENRMESNIPNYYFFSKIMKQVILLAQGKSQKSFVERPCVCLRKILPHGNDHGF